MHFDEERSDPESIEKPCSPSARRRIDAYHEALRERHALRDLDQPFVLDEARRGREKRSGYRHA
jgi:hypothetical protein